MRKILFYILLAILLLHASCACAQSKKSSARSAPPTRDPLSADIRFRPVDAILNDIIAKGQIPGAVVLVGQKGKIVYRKAYGNRALVPSQEPMTVDTIFDIASLTKCVATATSIVRMLELGQ